MKDKSQFQIRSAELIRWTAFHFGVLSEDEYLKAERELLLDSETLVNYLDIKRGLDGQTCVPYGPSANLRARLVQKVVRHRKPLYIVAAGLAVAASIAVFMTLHTPAPIHEIQTHSTLFDSADELPASSSVL